MSEFLQSLDMLNRAIIRQQDLERKRQASEQEDRARKKVASKVRNTIEGQTGFGEVMATGIESGVINPEKAMSLQESDPMKLFAEIQKAAVANPSLQPLAVKTLDMMKRMKDIEYAFKRQDPDYQIRAGNLAVSQQRLAFDKEKFQADDMFRQRQHVALAGYRDQQLELQKEENRIRAEAAKAKGQDKETAMVKLAKLKKEKELIDLKVEKVWSEISGESSVKLSKVEGPKLADVFSRFRSMYGDDDALMTLTPKDLYDSDLFVKETFQQNTGFSPNDNETKLPIGGMKSGSLFGAITEAGQEGWNPFGSKNLSPGAAETIDGQSFASAIQKIAEAKIKDFASQDIDTLFPYLNSIVNKDNREALINQYVKNIFSVNPNMFDDASPDYELNKNRRITEGFRAYAPEKPLIPEKMSGSGKSMWQKVQEENKIGFNQ